MIPEHTDIDTVVRGHSRYVIMVGTAALEALQTFSSCTRSLPTQQTREKGSEPPPSERSAAVAGPSMPRDRPSTLDAFCRRLQGARGGPPETLNPKL